MSRAGIVAVIRIGTSGWSYPNWQGKFYPPGLKRPEWLAFDAGNFETVELNVSFHRLPTPAMIERWAAAVPSSFVCFDLAGLRAPRPAIGRLAYVRLHGHERRYRGRYPHAVLMDWAAWLAAQRSTGREALVYLVNAMLADDALGDALTLGGLLGSSLADAA